MIKVLFFVIFTFAGVIAKAPKSPGTLPPVPKISD
jgi:hypothetical protein